MHFLKDNNWQFITAHVAVGILQWIFFLSFFLFQRNGFLDFFACLLIALSDNYLSNIFCHRNRLCFDCFSPSLVNSCSSVVNCLVLVILIIMLCPSLNPEHHMSQCVLCISRFYIVCSISLTLPPSFCSWMNFKSSCRHKDSFTHLERPFAKQYHSIWVRVLLVWLIFRSELSIIQLG